MTKSKSIKKINKLEPIIMEADEALAYLKDVLKLHNNLVAKLNEIIERSNEN